VSNSPLIHNGIQKLEAYDYLWNMLQLVLYPICPFRWWVRPGTIPLNFIGPRISDLNKFMPIHLSYLQLYDSNDHWKSSRQTWTSSHKGLCC
jgi:hypothetical protein